MGVFKLGKMTFGSLFKKPETVMYPVQTKTQPVGLKGHIQITEQECILCGMCERSCTTNCITVDKSAKTWQINRFQCVQCGYCITVCPKKCLAMNPNYAAASTECASDIVEVPVADKPKAKKKEQAEAPGKAEGKKQPAEAAPSAMGEPVKNATTPAKPDAALESKIALMDAERAAIVKQALAARK